MHISFVRAVTGRPHSTRAIPSKRNLFHGRERQRFAALLPVSLPTRGDGLGRSVHDAALLFDVHGEGTGHALRRHDPEPLCGIADGGLYPSLCRGGKAVCAPWTGTGRQRRGRDRPARRRSPARRSGGPARGVTLRDVVGDANNRLIQRGRRLKTANALLGGWTQERDWQTVIKVNRGRDNEVNRAVVIQPAGAQMGSLGTAPDDAQERHGGPTPKPGRGSGSGPSVACGVNLVATAVARHPVVRALMLRPWGAKLIEEHPASIRILVIKHRIAADRTLGVWDRDRAKSRQWPPGRAQGPSVGGSAARAVRLVSVPHTAPAAGAR